MESFRKLLQGAQRSRKSVKYMELKCDKDAKIPLKSISYQIFIQNSFARVELIQDYSNDSDKQIEAIFYFSISNEACFDSFQAEFNGKIVKGIIKEKKDAINEYEQEKSKGNLVIFSEKCFQNTDIMKIKIGNIPPNKQIKITFSYFEMLQVCVNKFWRFVLPSTFTPKYNSSKEIKTDPNIISPKTINESDPNAYSWKIFGTIESTSKIVFAKSPTHENCIIQIEKDNNNFAYFEIGEENKEFPNKDFVILFRNDEINKPQVVLTENTNDDKMKYCSMLTFFPDFNENNNNDAYQAFVENNQKDDYYFNMMAARGEYIFMLDRSGSMSGSRIELAKNALVLFLKSLPPDSFCNIISFGSAYNFYEKISFKTEPKSIEKAVNCVEKMKADMGGTELYSALKRLNDEAPIENYPKNIFILTDGAVNDTIYVINLIEKMSNYARCYTIGIGNGCSQELIEEGALAGKGKCEFIKDINEDINSKVISLLKDSITPFYSNFSLEYDKKYVEMLSPQPEAIYLLRKNEPFNLFMFFNQNFEIDKKTEIILNCFDSRTNKNMRFSLEINLENKQNNKNIVKLAIWNKLKDLARAIIYEERLENDVFFAKIDNIEKIALDFSLKYQLLNQLTSFICVIENEDKIDQIEIEKVLIPILESEDIFLPKTLGAYKSMDRSFKLCSAANYKAKKSAGCCGGGGGGVSYKKSNDSEINTKIDRNINLEKNEKKIENVFIEIVKKQSYEGFWKYSKEILDLIEFDEKEFEKNIPEDLKVIIKNYSLLEYERNWKRYFYNYFSFGLVFCKI